ncbi:MAG: PAS domain S-box protein [Gammaproteobacteria bacterium]|nr:PAS domain S-box protein [Gammaproteobacteria bacterium]
MSLATVTPLQSISERLVYEQVFDNALVGICLMSERRFIRVNRRLEEVLGYPPGALIGESVRRVYARAEDYEEVGRVLAAFPVDNRYVHERALITRDGAIRWCLVSGRLIEPADPRSASVWVVQDITDMREAEARLAREKERLEQKVQRRTLNLQKTNAALRQEIDRRRASERETIESREKYRVLFRNIPLGIVITDADGVIAEINPAMQTLSGVTSLEQFNALAARADTVTVNDGEVLSLAGLIARESPVDSHRVTLAGVSLRLPGAEARWFDVIGLRVPVRGLGAAIVFGDRTEARLAREREHAQQQQLAHATRLSLMGQFASALAHELGQPLNACLSYAAGIEHRLRHELQARPDAREALSRIQLHLTQAGDVIRNVRAFIAKHRPDDESVDLAVLVPATLDLLKLQLRQAAVRVQVSMPAGVPLLRGNRVELQQVLVNLIVNAIEAMRDAGVADPVLGVRVARRRGGRVAVTVSDNGPGVAAELREQIFQPYFTTKSGGLGMGLLMCRTIVESHGGSLAIARSRRRGAAFTFVLPAAVPVDGRSGPDLPR